MELGKGGQVGGMSQHHQMLLLQQQQQALAHQLQLQQHATQVSVWYWCGVVVLLV